MQKETPKRKLPIEFEIEEAMNDPARREKLLKHCDERLQKIKSHIRKGASKEDFDMLGKLLSGYESLEKVIYQKRGD